MRLHTTTLASLACLLALSSCDQKPDETAGTQHSISLDKAGLKLTVTPDFGGRVSHFSLIGSDSVVKFDQALAEELSDPALTPETGAPAYHGSALWVAPQSEWWNNQDVWPELAGESWPPDPYISLQRTVAQTDKDHVTLTGEPSPVLGLQLQQDFELLKGGCMKVIAQATNTRQTPVEWDLWFNTHIPGDALIFTPISSLDTVSYGVLEQPAFLPPELQIDQGIGFVSPQFEVTGEQGRKGKIFMHPDEGWMGAYVSGQVFVIAFDLLPREDIHPEQGQVEFYLSQIKSDADASSIEIESHAAFKRLQPGEAMQAVQYWAVAEVSLEQGLSARVQDARRLVQKIENCKEDGS